MHRKHYVLLAEWLGHIGVPLSMFEYLLGSLSVTLKRANPNFDQEKFMEHARNVRHDTNPDSGEAHREAQ
jgi:hypothetical protein